MTNGRYLSDVPQQNIMAFSTIYSRASSHGGVSNLIASAAAKLIYWLSIEKSQYTNYMSDCLVYFYNRVTGE